MLTGRMFDCLSFGQGASFASGKGSPNPYIGSGEAADIGASRRPSQSKPALSGTYPCPSRLGQTWIGSRPLKMRAVFVNPEVVSAGAGSRAREVREGGIAVGAGAGVGGRGRKRGARPGARVGRL